MNIKLKFKILENYPSQVAFAKDLGIDDTELSKFVRGWRSPKPELKKIIAQKLRCNLDEISPPIEPAYFDLAGASAYLGGALQVRTVRRLVA
jgi:hypothetical protein